ncbi:MAG: hypothetical protein ACPH26_04155 [Candidatus Puniceispirillaceae bacterium]
MAIHAPRLVVLAGSPGARLCLAAMQIGAKGLRQTFFLVIHRF